VLPLLAATVADSERLRYIVRRVFEGSAIAGGATAVELLLGAPRARLLEALCSPATTTALARRLGVTPSAVSQHLVVLHRGGLVDRRRSGRTLLYQTSELGLALLDGALPGSGLKPELRSGLRSGS